MCVSVCVCCDSDVRNINREPILRVMGNQGVMSGSLLKLFRGVFLPRGGHGVFRVGASPTPKSGVLPTVADCLYLPTTLMLGGCSSKLGD